MPIAPSFLTRNGDSDLLADSRAFIRWLDGQPNNDDLALQESLVRLLEDVAARQPRITAGRIAAVLELDRCSLLLQSRLVKQYLHPALSEPVRQRLWHANDDLARWLAFTYEQMFVAVQGFFLRSKVKSLGAAVAARMFHYRGVQAKHGLFRYERWIPGRWKSLHAAYGEAVERGVARIPFAPDPEASAADRTSAEQEYLQILLLQRINNGNLTTAQIEVVATWLHGCTPLLSTSPPPLEGDGFWLDLGLGDGLLTKKPANPQGAVLYLDVGPLHAEIAKGEAELAGIASGPASPQQADAALRLTLLRRIDPLLRPTAKPIPRRGDRVPTDRPVVVALGLGGIATALQRARDEAAHQPRHPGLNGHGRNGVAAIGDAANDEAAADVIEYAGMEATPAGWRVHDTSDSGCRLVSQSQDATRLRLGGVLGIQDTHDGRWKIGVVRRLRKLAAGRVEVGVELIALQSLLISPKPIGVRDTGYSVDGIDVSEGRGFDALYLPPSSTGREAPRRTMLVPAGEYGEGRRFALELGANEYTMEFASPLERAKDWVWTTFAIVERADERVHAFGGGIAPA